MNELVYWHIQMQLPEGRGGGSINSLAMLEKPAPVIGTGEWDDIQCRYFKNQDDRGLKIGDIILVREGKKPIALCRIKGDFFKNEELSNAYSQVNFREVEVLDWYRGNDYFPQTQGTLERLINKTTSWKFINNWYQNISKDRQMTQAVDLVKFKKQIILQGPPGTGKTFMAKGIAFDLVFGIQISSHGEERSKQLSELEKSGQFKLIQFHPSYSYEDFVRGISAETMNNQLSYEVKNKILADFASIAYKNYMNVQKSPEEVSKTKQIESFFVDFKEFIQNKLVEEGPIQLTRTLNLVQVLNNSFQIRSENWAGDTLKFSQILKLYEYNITQRAQLANYPDIVNTVQYRTAYYFPVVNMFRDFVSAQSNSLNTEEKPTAIKNYVLIIDEINRANLPSVLGELIYALEYRGERVESMYASEEDGNTLILPPNLYIIGTMNTADRSVGHIDYAIRRRFAFVDILPQSLPDFSDKAKGLFEQVSKLFCKDLIDLEPSEYLSMEFRPSDVMLGHSYFIAKDDNELRLKVDYEIKPLLREYVKDGVLNETALEIIKTLNV